jgi:hypothetical protein
VTSVMWLGRAAFRIGVASAIVAAVAVEARAVRPPCPGQTFTVQGGPLLPGAPPTQVDTVTVAPDPAAIELSIGCGPANVVKPDKVRGVKRGTKVRATWKGCAGLEGKIKLRGIIVDACTRLTGKLKAKGFKRVFEATGSGDGTPCDPLAAAGQQGCVAGEKCTWVVLQDTPQPLGATACAPDGVKDLGDSCTVGQAGETTGFDDCKAGLICIGGQCQDVCGFDGSPEAACTAGYNCTRYSDLFANGSDDPIAGACAEGCNPLTQFRTSGSPCPAGQGCYLLTSSTETIAVCAGAGTIGHGELITGTPYANSCLPGLQPRRRDGNTQDIECGALCQVTDVSMGVNEADEGGVAPYTCAAKGAAAPDDPVNGESCRYWWLVEPFSATALSPYSNTVGWCLRHAAFQYDTDGDSVPDAPIPRCVALTTGNLLPPFDHPNDALYWGCMALPEPAALQASRMRVGR